MALKSTNFFLKIVTFTVFIGCSFVTFADDVVTNQLIFDESNDVVTAYRSLSSTQQAEWNNKLQANIEQASNIELLVATSHLYQTSQFKLAKKNITLLLSKTSDSTQPLMLANAWFLNGLNTAIGLDQFDDAVDVFKQAVTVIERVHNINEQQQLLKLSAVAHYRLGSLLLFLKQPDKAAPYLFRAINDAKLSSDERYLVTPTLELAKYYIAKNKPVLAEQQLIESYDIALATDSPRRADILHQLSRYYRKNKRYDLAIDYAKRSLRYRESQSDKLTHLPSAYNNLAIAYEESGDLNSALVHYLNAIKILEGKSGYHYLALATHNTGLIYQKQNKPDLALTYLMRANKLFNKMGHGYFLMSSHLSLADINFSEKAYQNAIKYGELALTAATKHNQATEKYQVLNYLAHSYLAIQQYQRAAEYFADYAQLQRDEITSLTKKVAEKGDNIVVDNTELKANFYDIKSQLNEKKLQNAQQKRTINSLYYLLCFIVISFMTASMLFIRSHRQKHSLAQKLNVDAATQLINLQNEKQLLATVNSEFIFHQHIFALKIPLMSRLTELMGIDKAQQLRVHLIHQLSEFIDQPIFKLTDDTFIFAKDPTNEQNVAQRFAALTAKYLELIPDQLKPLSTQYPLLLGCVKRSNYGKKVNLIQAKNMINLALTALSVVNHYRSKTITTNWLIVSEKESSSTELFTCPTRKEWLQLANNNMLTVDSGLDNDINWLDIPHYSV